VFQQFLASRIRTNKLHCRRENNLASLSSLYCPRYEGATVADVFDVVDYGDVGVAGQNKVAVHAVDGEVLGDGVLSCRKALGYYCAAIDAAGSGRVPQWPRVGVEVLRMQ
jgi:hypothetical protein